ncbi:hypothetical protein Ancab_014145 [Ancistrocladus abbreviatus]
MSNAMPDPMGPKAQILGCLRVNSENEKHFPSSFSFARRCLLSSSLWLNLTLRCVLPLKRASVRSFSSLGAPFLLRHGSIQRLQSQRALVLPPKGLAGIGLIATRRLGLNKRLIVSFAASHEGSKKAVSAINQWGDGSKIPYFNLDLIAGSIVRSIEQNGILAGGRSSKIDCLLDPSDSVMTFTNVGNRKNDFNQQNEESEEAWEQVLASFKGQAIRLQNVSQEAYEVYSKKVLVILKETAEQLQIQADKARNDLSIIANEIGEEGKQYLATAAESSPESVKDVMETFAYSTDDLSDISKVRDFYIGIPYGAMLSLGGFLYFMLTGSISAIRFGVILGGALLALSISSLRSWKKRESSKLALKGQAAIAGVLFLRDIRLLSQGPSFARLVITAISGAVATFYLYRMIRYKQPRKSNLDGETQT